MNIITRSLFRPFLFQGFSIRMTIRNIKPVLPRLITDNPPKEDELYQSLQQIIDEEQRLGSFLEYDTLMPGVFRTYPRLVEAQENELPLLREEEDYQLRSKRHRVAKLKRSRRKHGKRTQIQNN